MPTSPLLSLSICRIGQWWLCRSASNKAVHPRIKQGFHTQDGLQAEDRVNWIFGKQRIFNSTDMNEGRNSNQAAP
jgi:hypothetical protein